MKRVLFVLVSATVAGFAASAHAQVSIQTPGFGLRIGGGSPYYGSPYYGSVPYSRGIPPRGYWDDWRYQRPHHPYAMVSPPSITCRTDWHNGIPVNRTCW